VRDFFAIGILRLRILQRDLALFHIHSDHQQRLTVVEGLPRRRHQDTQIIFVPQCDPKRSVASRRDRAL
jgi:hypothetical protein